MQTRAKMFALLQRKEQADIYESFTAQAVKRSKWSVTCKPWKQLVTVFN